jgi:hypothetical protein
MPYVAASSRLATNMTETRVQPRVSVLSLNMPNVRYDRLSCVLVAFHSGFWITLV